jgi:hypothetical protein
MGRSKKLKERRRERKKLKRSRAIWSGEIQSGSQRPGQPLIIAREAVIAEKKKYRQQVKFIDNGRMWRPNHDRPIG